MAEGYSRVGACWPDRDAADNELKQRGPGTQWSFLKLIDLILKKIKTRNFKKQLDLRQGG